MEEKIFITFPKNKENIGTMISRIHLTEEEVYDIFRVIFYNEEDALAATIQLFSGDPISWDEDYE